MNTGLYSFTNAIRHETETRGVTTKKKGKKQHIVVDNVIVYLKKQKRIN